MALRLDTQQAPHNLTGVDEQTAPRTPIVPPFLAGLGSEPIQVPGKFK